MAERQLAMLTTLSPEELVPVDHPIRRIRVVVEAVLAELEGHVCPLGTSERPARAAVEGDGAGGGLIHGATDGLR
jgi:hypothetical protein